MAKNSLSEKVLYVAQFLIDSLVIYGNLYFAIPDYRIDQEVFTSSEALKTVFLKYHFMLLLGILLVIGAILLWRSKKMGWVISLPSWIIFSIVTIWVTFYKNIYSTELRDPSEFSAVSVIILLICFAPVVFYLSSKFRTKYRINPRDWIFAAGVLCYFIVDLILFQGTL